LIVKDLSLYRIEAYFRTENMVGEGGIGPRTAH